MAEATRERKPENGKANQAGHFIFDSKAQPIAAGGSRAGVSDCARQSARGRDFS